MRIDLHYDLTEREARLGESVHTILRKYSDSNWSSLVWNMVHVTPNWIWEGFLKYLCTKIDEGGLSEQTILTAFQNFDTYWYMENIPVECDHQSEFRTVRDLNNDWNIMIVFESALSMMPDHDARIIADVLRDYWVNTVTE